jgi:hypothetical protein
VSSAEQAAEKGTLALAARTIKDKGLLGTAEAVP